MPQSAGRPRLVLERRNAQGIHDSLNQIRDDGPARNNNSNNKNTTVRSRRRSSSTNSFGRDGGAFRASAHGGSTSTSTSSSSSAAVPNTPARQQLFGALTTDISNRHWDYARKTFRRNTSAVSTEVDPNGNTPLHWLMKAPDAPLDFAELVLASYPEAAVVQEHIHGSTPLHIACEEYKVGEGTKIEMLLNLAGHSGVATVRNNAGQLPIDILLQRLEAHRIQLSFPPLRVLSLFPEFLALWTATYGECVAAAAMKDWDGVRQLLRSKVEGPMQKDYFDMIPIDYAVRYNAPESLLAQLAKAYPVSEGIVLFPMLHAGQWAESIALLSRNPVAGEWMDKQGRVALNHAFLDGASISELQEMRIASPESVAKALAFALEKGDPKMARALVEAGCDVKFYLEDFKHEKPSGPLTNVGAASNGNGNGGGGGGGGGGGLDGEGGFGADAESEDPGSETAVGAGKSKRELPVTNALVAAHTILSATLTDMDVTGVNNALGMIFSRRDVMEFHRRMMENQGLRSGRHKKKPARLGRTTAPPGRRGRLSDYGGGGGGDDDDDDADPETGNEAATRRSLDYLYHRFDDAKTPGTLHYKATVTLASVYEKMESIQATEKLGSVTKPISDWVLSHVYPGLVPSHRMSNLRKGSKVARKLQHPADLILRQDRMPNSIRAVATSATGGVALTGSADDVELLPSTSCAFVTEHAYAHILHLIARALDKSFHKTVSLALTDRVPGCKYVAAAPKSVAKMVSNISTRHAAQKRPRPAHNVDCLRCLVNYIDAAQLLDGFAQMQSHFQILHVTNGYADWYDSRAEFGFRAVTVHIVYEPKTTFGQMVKSNSKVRKFLDNYVDSVDREERTHARVALEWIQHSRIAAKDVRMVAEVQLVYAPFVAECLIKANVYRLILEAKTAQQLHDIFSGVGSQAYHHDDDDGSQHDTLARYREGYQRRIDQPRTSQEDASLQLLEATKVGNVPLMARLVRQNADVNYQHPHLHSWTPLHIGVFFGQKEALKFLLSAGADCQQEDTWDDRPEDYSSIILELEDELQKNPFGGTASALLPVHAHGNGDGDEEDNNDSEESRGAAQSPQGSEADNQRPSSSSSQSSSKGIMRTDTSKTEPDSRPVTAVARFSRSMTVAGTGSGSGSGSGPSSTIRRASQFGVRRRLHQLSNVGTLPLEMRHSHRRAPKFIFSPPEITKYPGGRLEKFRHEKRMQRRAEGLQGAVRHKSAAHAADAVLDAQEAAAEAERKRLILKPDFHKIRKERERLATQRKLEENEKIIRDFRRKHCQ